MPMFLGFFTYGRIRQKVRNSKTLKKISKITSEVITGAVVRFLMACFSVWVRFLDSDKAPAEFSVFQSW